MEDTRPTRQHAWGEISQRMLSQAQSEALAGAPDAVVLVEGLSDRAAVQAVARKTGRKLEDEGIAIVPMGGATNIRRFLTTFGPRGRDVRIAVLCDAAESAYFAQALTAADADGELAGRLFVCHRDLEDELIRALGGAAVEAVIDQRRRAAIATNAATDAGPPRSSARPAAPPVHGHALGAQVPLRAVARRGAPARGRSPPTS